MDKEERRWRLGRRGEIIQLATLKHFDFPLIDVSGSSNRKAPLVHRRQFNLIAPDAMSFKTRQLWMEFKTKVNHEQWFGGSKSDAVKVSARLEQGIDRVNFESYLKVQEETKTPIVLMVLCITEGELLANRLDCLGEPRYSTHPAYDLVNWPISKFISICHFDCEEMHNYFYDKRGVARPAPTDVPSAESQRRWLDRLKPVQSELDLVRRELISQIEKHWAR